jgi:hypothetical protein
MISRKILEEAYRLTLPSTGRWAVALLAGTVTSGLMFAPPAGAASPSATLGPLVQISGPSPFGGCTADNVGGQEAQGSVNFPDSEIEPFIDVNPGLPRRMIAVWQQDRWSDGGSRGLVAGVSSDNGATWNTVTSPKFTVCQHGRFERASDPWITFGPTGAAYFMSLSFDFDPTVFGGHSAMQVSKSQDSGHTWLNPVTLIEDNDPNVINDKNSLTADSTNRLRVFAIWDRLELFSASAAQQKAVAQAIAGQHDKVIMAGRTLRSMQANAAAAATDPPQFKGPTYFTRTKDAGVTWDRPIIIHDPGANNQTINNQILVEPNGTLIVMFTEILNLANGVHVEISLKRSTDSGFSFVPINGVIHVTRIFSLAIANPTGTTTPNLNEPVRDAGLLFDPAVDPHNGHLYVVWQDNRFSRNNPAVDQIAFAQSTDRGATWSQPIKINKTPFRLNVKRTAAFIPTIAVNSDGVLVATYYDFRNDDATGELADQFAVFCDPASSDCTKSANWGGEKRLTDASFDMLDAPVARGHFLGDYMGSASVTQDVHPAFGIADGANQTSIFTRNISLAPTVAAASQ